MTVGAARRPLALLLELLWVFAAAAVVVQIVTAGDGPAPSFIAVAVALLGAHSLGRALREIDVEESTLRAIAVAVSVAAIVVIVHGEYAFTQPPWDLAWLRALVVDRDADRAVIAGTVVLVVAWMRGVVGGQQPPDFEHVAANLGVGLVPITIAAASSPVVRGLAPFGAIAIVYVVLALCTLALYQSPDPERPIARFGAQWAGAIVALIGVAALLTIVAAAFDPSSFGVLSPIGRPLVLALAVIAEFVLGPIAAGIAWLVEALLPSLHHDAPTPTNNSVMPKHMDNATTPLWQQILGWVLVGGGLALLAVGAMVVMWLLVRRLVRRRETTHERRESVAHEGLLVDDLAAMFGALANRFRRSPRDASALPIRRLYADMLDQAADGGLVRPDAATPLEFAPPLDARFAAHTPSEITAAFNASRYGDREIDDAMVRALRQQLGDRRTT